MDSKREIKYKVTIVFLVLNLVFYGCFVVHHYAADTYLTEALVWHETVMQYFMNGRWLMSAFAYLCEIFNISHNIQQLMSWSISILSITLASSIIHHLLLKKSKKNPAAARSLWGILASFMMVSNVFLVEYFIFAEYTGMICLGILFDVIAATLILEFIQSKKGYQYFLGIVFAILGINGHQGSFAIFVVVCVVFSNDMFDNFKKFIKNNLIIGSAYLIPCLVNVWESRIGGTSRATRSINVAASFEKITEGLINLFKSTANFMSYGIYALFVAIIGIYFLYHIFKGKSWRIFFTAAYCGIIAILGIYAPLLMTEINAIDVVPRTVYIMGSVIPIVLFLILIRVMSNDWAAPLAIQCLEGYKIESTEKSDDIYKEHFEGKDWTQMNDEQFVIIGDTLHLCAY